MSKRHELTALIYDKRGRLLSVGKNSFLKTHPLQKRYATKAGNKHKIYLHAEIDAILKARSRGVPHKIVVTRFHNDGTPALAKPCKGCMLAINDSGITEVEWTE